MIMTRWRFTCADWAESHQRLYGDGPDDTDWVLVL
jgi:hypothetical protein